MRKSVIGIVEDNDVLRCSLADFIRSIGHSPKVFDSAEKFLDLATECEFACVIADVQMPGIGGLELVSRLRSSGSTTPIILLTALPNKRVDTRAASAGVSVLTKPFIGSTLMNYVQASVDASAVRGQEKSK